MVKSVEQKVKSLPSSRIFCRHVFFLSLSPKIVYAWLISGCGFTAPFFFFNQKPKVCMTEVVLLVKKKKEWYCIDCCIATPTDQSCLNMLI